MEISYEGEVVALVRALGFILIDALKSTSQSQQFKSQQPESIAFAIKHPPPMKICIDGGMISSIPDLSLECTGLY